MHLLDMNWYKIFYWVTVADGVKGFFDVISTMFLVFMIIAFVFYVGYYIYIQSEGSRMNKEELDVQKRWHRHFRTMFIWFTCLMCVTWSCYVFCPSKKDAAIIIAGGAIGNFIVSDSSSKQIPAELTMLVREKLKSEINDIKVGDMLQTDTLKNKTKEELIEILKKKQ